MIIHVSFLEGIFSQHWDPTLCSFIGAIDFGGGGMFFLIDVSPVSLVEPILRPPFVGKLLGIVFHGLTSLMGWCLHLGELFHRDCPRIFHFPSVNLGKSKESLVEVQGDYVKNLPPERLEGLRRLFPEVDVETEGLRLVHEDRGGLAMMK